MGGVGWGGGREKEEEGKTLSCPEWAGSRNVFWAMDAKAVTPARHGKAARLGEGEAAAPGECASLVRLC